MEKTVHVFQKNAVEEVRAFLSEYKKRDYINLRVFYKADDGSMRPTQKGITLSVDLIDELVAAVDAFKRAVESDE